MNNILIVTPQNIIPPVDGGKLCMYSRILALQGKNNHVYLAMGNANIDLDKVYPKAMSHIRDYISLPRKNKEIKKSNFKDICVEVFKWFVSGKPRQAQTLFSIDNRKSAMAFIVDKGIDVIVLETVFASELIDIDLCKKMGIRLVVVEHNVEYEFIKDCMPNMRFASCIESSRIKSYEKRIDDLADEVIAISPYDADKLKRELNISNIKYLPVTLINQSNKWEGNDSSYILFAGSLKFAPNFRGIKWFLENIWHQYYMKYPNVKLKISGSFDNKGRNLISEHRNVVLTGFIDELEFDQLKRNALFEIIPIISGSGIKIKLLEALSMGIPVIGTQHCYDGIPFSNDITPYCVAKNAQEFLEAMILLTDNKKMRIDFSKRGYEFYNSIYASNSNMKNWIDMICNENNMVNNRMQTK